MIAPDGSSARQRNDVGGPPAPALVDVLALASTSDSGCYAANITNTFAGDSLWDSSKPATTTTLALRAWLSCYVPTIPDMEERYRDAKPINLKSTEKWPEPVSDLVC